MTDLCIHAASLGCDVDALRAVIDVESAGAPFDGKGRPLIRVEAHRLWAGVRAKHGSGVEVDRWFAVRGPRPWEGHRVRVEGRWVPYHGDPDLEWLAYGIARGIDPEEAIEATSWGLGQVLGIHWRRLGYGSAQDFVDSMATEEGQLDAMVRFIGTSPALKRSLQTQDWREFARQYNGSGQVEEYAHRLMEARR